MSHLIKSSSTNQANKKHLSERCSVNDTLAFIGKRWLMAILYEISLGHNQFSGLLAVLSGLSEHILAARIQDLDRNGLITKTPQPDSVPMQICYTITPKGYDLLVIMDQLHHWTEVHSDEDPEL